MAAQVADLVLENIGAQDWVIQTPLFLLALGFVAALIIAWAYEVTPEGIRRESEVDRSVSVTEQTGQRLNIITIGLVVVALGVFAFDRLSPAGETGLASSDTAAANDERRAGGGPDESKPAPVTASGRSIAVLPFVALSVDENDAFFGKGIA